MLLQTGDYFGGTQLILALIPVYCLIFSSSLDKNCFIASYAGSLTSPYRQIYSKKLFCLTPHFSDPFHKIGNWWIPMKL
jgi:hypothetical protein